MDASVSVILEQLIFTKSNHATEIEVLMEADLSELNLKFVIKDTKKLLGRLFVRLP